MAAEEKYRVVFNSQEIERRYRRHAKRQMAKKFRLSRKKVNQLFSCQRFTIKKNITFHEAVRLQLVVEKIGGACEIRLMVRKAVSLFSERSRELTQTVPSHASKTVSSWFDHVAGASSLEGVRYRSPTPERYRRQVDDRRLEQDRRLAIRMEIERREADDRREENRVWKGSWVK